MLIKLLTIYEIQTHYRLGSYEEREDFGSRVKAVLEETAVKPNACCSALKGS